MTPDPPSGGTPRETSPVGEAADAHRWWSGPPKANLARRSVRGVFVTLAGQGTSLALHLAHTVVLARLLAPSDFGLVAMTAAVTGFVAVFVDAGLSAATVQREEVNADQVSALFWLNVGAGLLVAVLCAALAPALVWFYGEPRLLEVTLVLSINFVLGGLAVQHTALLKRQMRFTALAAIPLASQLLSTLSAVACAFFGLGYWAIVVGALVGALSTTLLVWGVCRWVPSLPRRGADVSALLRFGGNLTGFNVVNYVVRNLDNLLIGRFVGAEALGLYDRAYQLMLSPLRRVNEPVAAVAVPALSRLQNEPERYRRAYVRVLEKLALATVPALAFAAASAGLIVEILLGEEWRAVTPLFTWLALAGLPQPISNTTGWLFISQGRTHEMLRWGVLSAILTSVAFVAGLPWGALGVAAAYALSGLARFPLVIYFVTRRGPVQLSDYIRPVSLAGSVAAAVGGAALVARSLLPPLAPTLELLFTFVTAASAGTIVLLATPSGRAALRDTKALLGELAPGRREERSATA